MIIFASIGVSSDICPDIPKYFIIGANATATMELRKI
jgi:hypothetical protein